MHILFKRILSSAGAIFATRSSPGTILVEQQQQNDFSVVDCSLETVTIRATSSRNTIDRIIEPGHVLAYIGANDDSFGTPCHSLFRKIVSYNGDNTFKTQMATFSEVFPKSTYDESLADALVEPMLMSDVEDIIHANKNGRRLNDDDDDGVDCGDVRYANTLFFIFMFSVILCPIGWLGALITMFILRVECGSNDLTPIRYWYNQRGTRNLEETKNMVPSSHSDWFQLDRNGKCLFADCYVGGQGDSSQCFKCDSDDVFCGNTLLQLASSNAMIAVPSDDSNRFTDAWENQYYCYSSSKFDKATCDKQFLKSARESCNSNFSPSSVTFPLDGSDFIENCDMTTVLMYLSVHKFGDKGYHTLQFQQHQHHKEFCNSNMF